MFLTVHSAVGLAASKYFHQPILAFIAGFIMHYVFDIIPHGDTRAPKKYHNVIYMTLAGLIDLSLVSATLIFIMLSQNRFLTWVELAAITGSVLPDALLFLQFIFSKNKYLKKLKNFHHFIHSTISKKFELPFIPGIILQIILFIIVITLYL
jgi:hypothetical protein